MDIIIKPFWIIIALVYSFLAWYYYRLSKEYEPLYPSKWIESVRSLGESSEYNQRSDPTAIHLANLMDFYNKGVKRNKTLLKLASLGFLLAAIISLLQGLLDLETALRITIS